MKLRIRGNSLRLRLSQGEVQALEQQGGVEDAIAFPGGKRLIYKLRSDTRISEISAAYIDNLIEIRIPLQQVVQWSESDRVGLSAILPIASGELRVAVEKDFACLTRREGEDESDNFPHPQAHGGKRC